MFSPVLSIFYYLKIQINDDYSPWIFSRQLWNDLFIKTKDRSLLILGKRIREQRKEKGFSQEGLAYEAGLDRSYMGGIERGERNPSFQTLCLIAKAIKTDVGTLARKLPRS